MDSKMSKAVYSYTCDENDHNNETLWTIGISDCSLDDD